VARRQASGESGTWAVLSNAITTACPDLFWLVQPTDMKGVRMLLVPLQTCLLAVHPDGKVILLANCYLAGVKKSRNSTFEPQENIAIVVEWPSLDKRSQHGADLYDAQASNVLCQVGCMRTNISETAG